MLIGSAEVKVEKQGRFKLPGDFVRQWADQDLPDELFATTLMDRRLLLYPRTAFDRLMSDVHSQPTVSRPAMRMVHALNRNGAPTTLDKEHRIALPARLRRMAADHMDFEPPASALLVGCNDHLELLFDAEPVRLDDDDLDQLSTFRIAPLSP